MTGGPDDAAFNPPPLDPAGGDWGKARIFQWSGGVQTIPRPGEEDAMGEEAGAEVKTPRVQRNTGNVEWYTPVHIIEAARRVMGSIDFDPASSEEANRTVRAGRFMTASFSALSPEADWWGANVWMNPPYSPAFIPRKFVERLIGEIAEGDVLRAIVLTNNNTETIMGQMLLKECAAVCFPKGRLKFIRPDGCDDGGPTQGQMITALGDISVPVFGDVFHDIGRCLV